MGGDRKTVLISGAGVAGPALAWWLDHFGFEPSMVEIAPEFRSGGYMIDFWGKGFDLIEAMGVLPEVERLGYHIQEVRFVHSDGRRAGGFSTAPFATATGGRFISLPRGELARTMWEALPTSVETRFCDEVARIEPAGNAVRVHFARSEPRVFDLVIGADGVHSQVRQLAFGAEEQVKRSLGYGIAAFTVEGYPKRTRDVYMGYSVPCRSVARVSMRDDRTLMLFLWCEDAPSLPHSDADRRALLREKFSGIGWECDLMLDALDRSTDLYADTASQIRLPRWSSGRVALVGDAAWAPSFLAGEGCGLGIIGAYVLAGELARADGDPRAFAAYEQRLRKLIKGKQKVASQFGGAFVPKTRLGVAIRNHVASLLNIKLVANIALSGVLKDDIDLPDYGAGEGAAAARP